MGGLASLLKFFIRLALVHFQKYRLLRCILMQFQKRFEPKVYPLGIILLTLPSQELGLQFNLFLLCFEILVLCLQYAQTCMNLNWMLKKEWKYRTFVCISYSKIALKCMLNPSYPISIYVIYLNFSPILYRKRKIWWWRL